VQGLVAMKMMRPSLIQFNSIPLIINSNQHLLAQSRNGSGKTISFLVGAIMKIDLSKEILQVLIISPNRELMNQTYTVCLNLVKFLNGIKVAKLIDLNGDTSFTRSHLIVSTPGIAVKSFKKGLFTQNTIRVVVFDEADIMLGSPDKDHCSIIARNMKAEPNVQLLGFTATINTALSQWFDSSFNNV